MARDNSYCRTVAALCALFILAGTTSCGGGGGSGGGNTSLSNVTGKAFHEIDGGACCNPPVDTPLPSALLTFHTPASTVQVASAKTDASGNYSVMLPAGTYSVDLSDRSNEPFYNTVNPQQFQVSLGTLTQVDIKFIEDVP